MKHRQFSLILWCKNAFLRHLSKKGWEPLNWLRITLCLSSLDTSGVGSQSCPDWQNHRALASPSSGRGRTASWRARTSPRGRWTGWGCCPRRPDGGRICGRKGGQSKKRERSKTGIYCLTCKGKLSSKLLLTGKSDVTLFTNIMRMWHFLLSVSEI